MTQSLMERKASYLVLLDIVILQNIRMKKERKNTLRDMEGEIKTGRITKRAGCGLKIFNGTNQLLKHQLKIPIKSFLI